MFIAWIQIRWI